MKSNPHIITFNDLIHDVKDRLEWMEKFYPARIQQGYIQERHARRNIQIQKRILKLLNKYRRNPQLDLFEVYQHIKSKSTA
jgi:hypothetical protein